MRLYPSLPVLIVSAALLLSGCGYHRIGQPTQALKAGNDPAPTMPTRVVKDEPQLSAAAYFPLQQGTAYRYSRTYEDQGAAGYRTMTVTSVQGAGDGKEAWISNRLETGSAAMALQYSGRVSTVGGMFTAALPGFPNVHTLMGFALKSSFRANTTWDAEIDGRAWSFAARGTERVVVPVGAYDCLVVEAFSSSRSQDLMQLTKQVLYFAPGVGLVKVALTVSEQRDSSFVNHEVTEQLVSVSSS